MTLVSVDCGSIGLLAGNLGVDLVGGFAEGDLNAAFDFERRDRGLGRFGLGFALIAFVGERDAAFGHDHPAFG